jgi:hypothetical protein
MEVLVNLLGKSFKGSYSNEICSHIFQAIYSMCRLSKARQEEAASAGIIPMLKRTIVTRSPLKQFALPILCDLANAGKAARRLLWQNDGMSSKSIAFGLFLTSSLSQPSGRPILAHFRPRGSRDMDG